MRNKRSSVVFNTFTRVEELSDADLDAIAAVRPAKESEAFAGEDPAP